MSTPINDFRIVILIMVFLGVLLSFIPQAKGSTSLTCHTTTVPCLKTSFEYSDVESCKSYLITPRPVVISLFIDQSMSITNGLVDKVTLSQVLQLVDLIDAAPYGSRLTVSVIGESTKEVLVSYFNYNLDMLTPPPRVRGQSADDRRAAIERFRMMKSKAGTHQVDPDQARFSFIQRVKPLLAYDRMHYQSQVCEIHSLSSKVFSESEPNARRIILAVTDGLASSGSERCPFTLDSGVELFVINRAKHNGHLSWYRSTDFTSMGALLHHLNTSL